MSVKHKSATREILSIRCLIISGILGGLILVSPRLQALAPTSTVPIAYPTSEIAASPIASVGHIRPSVAAITFRYPSYQSVWRKLDMIRAWPNLNQQLEKLQRLERQLRKDDFKRAHQEPPIAPKNGEFYRIIAARKRQIIPLLFAQTNTVPATPTRAGARVQPVLAHPSHARRRLIEPAARALFAAAALNQVAGQPH